MPHLKIRTACSLAQIQAALAPFAERDDLGVHKLQACYLEREGDELLLDLLVAEGGLVPRHFFGTIRSRQGLLVLRCLPLTDPEKTDGVRRTLARVGRRLLALCPDGEAAGGSLASELAALGNAEAGEGP